MVEVIEVVVPASTAVIETVVPREVAVVEVVQVTGVQGPQGPQGPPGDGFAFEYAQASPLATWTIPVPVEFDRRPAVSIFLTTGESVIADVVSTDTTVTVTFASPVAGYAVLT